MASRQFRIIAAEAIIAEPAHDSGKPCLAVAAAASVAAALDESPSWAREEVESDNRRMADRVCEAAADPNGRLRLYLDNLQCDFITDDVGRISSLRELYCTHCPRVERLPLTLAKLFRSLQIIDASHCALKVVPEDLGRLPTLRKLDLSHNRLTSLFWDASGLVNLTYFDVSHNCLAYLSPQLKPLFERLRLQEAAAAVTELNPQRRLFVGSNPYLTPTSIDPHTWRLHDIPAVSPLSYLLPPAVEMCVACEKTIEVGPPFVFVHFHGIVSGEACKARAEPPADASGTTEKVRAPFFYPYCSANCCQLLQKLLIR